MTRIFNLKSALWGLVFWQAYSVLMIAVFNWPRELVWVNLLFSAIFIVLADTYDALIFFIASIPFYLVLPNGSFQTLSAWRPLVVLLFFVWFARDMKWSLLNIKWMPWDRMLLYFAALALAITLIFGKFPEQGIKQLFFFINIYALYAVLINTVKTREQILGVVKAVVFSGSAIVATGFLQLAYTFASGLETFWVFWASNISRIFYGDGFASVALYSNSWFSYTGSRELRMFGIQPDSQSFAYICVFTVGLALPLTIQASGKIRPWLWAGLRSVSLAIVLSGTRAVWVGILLPMLAALGSYFSGFYKIFAKKTLFIFAFIIILFAASPLINLGLNYLRYERRENFADRAMSIYNLREESNAGRLLIWQESLRNFVRSPWGVGLDNFLSTLNASPDFSKASEEINKRYNLPQKYITAHSLYLQILVELGAAGFVIFVLYWVKIGKAFYAFLRQQSGGEDFLVFLVFSAGAAFLWLLTAAVFDVTWFNDKVLMFFFITLGLSGAAIKNLDSVKK